MARSSSIRSGIESLLHSLYPFPGSVDPHPDGSRAAPEDQPCLFSGQVVPGNEQQGLALVIRQCRQQLDELTATQHADLHRVACHVSQASDNPVLWRRLELLGDTE